MWYHGILHLVVFFATTVTTILAILMLAPPILGTLESGAVTANPKEVAIVAAVSVSRHLWVTYAHFALGLVTILVTTFVIVPPFGRHVANMLSKPKAEVTPAAAQPSASSAKSKKEAAKKTVTPDGKPSQADNATAASKQQEHGVVATAKVKESLLYVNAQVSWLTQESGVLVVPLLLTALAAVSAVVIPVFYRQLSTEGTIEVRSFVQSLEELLRAVLGMSPTQVISYEGVATWAQEVYKTHILSASSWSDVAWLAWSLTVAALQGALRWVNLIPLTAPWCLLMIHYFHRTIIYPLRMRRQTASPYPWFVTFVAACYVCLNGTSFGVSQWNSSALEEAGPMILRHASEAAQASGCQGAAPGTIDDQLWYRTQAWMQSGTVSLHVVEVRAGTAMVPTVSRVVLPILRRIYRVVFEMTCNPWFWQRNVRLADGVNARAAAILEGHESIKYEPKHGWMDAVEIIMLEMEKINEMIAVAPYQLSADFGDLLEDPTVKPTIPGATPPTLSASSSSSSASSSEGTGATAEVSTPATAATTEAAPPSKPPKVPKTLGSFLIMAWVASAVLFFYAMALNIFCDRHLLGLKEANGGKYAIPFALPFEHISCPNFYYELMEWFAVMMMAWCEHGFLWTHLYRLGSSWWWYDQSTAASVVVKLIMSPLSSEWYMNVAAHPVDAIRALQFVVALTASLAPTAFFVYTFCNLVPRALAHHRWYHEKFPGIYPRLNRKAIIPHLL